MDHKSKSLVEDQPTADDAAHEESAEPARFGEDATGAAFIEPADHGGAAWTFLVGGFLVEMLSWAFQLSFGVFEDYFTTKTDFDQTMIPYIGTLAGGISFLICPIVIPLSTYKPHFRKPLMYAGLATCAVGAIGSSFATSAWHLIMGQGVLYGIGVSMLYLPIFSMLFEWFDKRRGLAAGIMFAGGGTSGVAFPFAFEWALDTYGNAFALRAWAIMLTILLLPILYLTRSRRVASSSDPSRASSRLSEAAVQTNEQSSPPLKQHRGMWQFLRSTRFWLFSFATLFQGLGFYAPTIWLPSYATALGLSTHEGTALATILNISCVVGQVVVGYLSDRMDVGVMLGLWQAATAAAVFGGWGFGRSFPALAVFAVAYGLFAGGFSSFWPRLAHAIPATAGDKLQTSLAFSSLSSWRGIGYLVSSPLSNALLRLDSDVGIGLRPYGPLILFAGTAFVIAAGGAWGRLART